MSAIYYNGPIKAVPTNQQLLMEKKTCLRRFRSIYNIILKTKSFINSLIYRQTNVQTDGHRISSSQL